MTKFEISVVDTNTPYVGYAEDDTQLRAYIDTSRWIEVENLLGEVFWVCTEHVTAIWEAEEEEVEVVYG